MAEDRIKLNELVEPGNPFVPWVDGLDELIKRIEVAQKSYKNLVDQAADLATKTNTSGKDLKDAIELKDALIKINQLETELTKLRTQRAAATSKLTDQEKAALELQKQREKETRKLDEALFKQEQLQRKVNAALEDNTTTTEELIKLQKQLNKGENTELWEKLNVRIAENTRLTSKLTEEERAALELQKQREKETKKLNEQLFKQEQAERALIATANKAIKSQKDLREQTNALVAIRDRLDTTTEEGIKEWDRLTDKIRTNTETLMKNDEQIKRFQRNVGNYKSALSGVGDGLLNIAGGLGIATASSEILLAGINTLQEAYSETIKIQTDLNNVIKDGSENIDELTISVRQIAKNFDADYNEIIVAANAVSKEFGITMASSLDMIREGFDKGSNANGEFLEMMKEYPTKFKDTKIAAEQMFAVINTAVTRGVYSDKGADAIKEASELLAEMPIKTRDALKILGFSSNEIEKRIKDGSINSFEFIQQISKGISGLEQGSSKARAAIDGIFGTPGLDAGYGFLTVLQTVPKSMSEITDTTPNVTKSMRNLNDEWIKLTTNLVSGSGDFSAALSGIVDFAAELLAKSQPVLDVFSNLYDEVKGLVSVFYDLGKQLGLFNNSASSADALISALVFTMKIAYSGTRAIIWVITKLAEGFQWLATETGIFGEALVWPIKKLAELYDWLFSTNEAIIDINQSTTKMTASLSKWAQSLQNAIQNLGGVKKEEKTITEEQRKQYEERKKMREEYDKYLLSSAKASREKEIKEAERTTSEMIKKFKDIAGSKEAIEKIGKAKIDEINQRYDLMDLQRAEDIAARKGKINEKTERQLLEIQLNYSKKRTELLTAGTAEYESEMLKRKELELAIQKTTLQYQYDALEQSYMNELAFAELETTDQKELAKKKLEIEMQFLQQKLALYEKFATSADSPGGSVITEEEKNQIESISKSIQRIKYALGQNTITLKDILGDEGAIGKFKSSLSELSNTFFGFLTQLQDATISQNEEAIAASEARIEQLNKEVEYEKEAKDKAYAYTENTANDEILAEKRKQEKLKAQSEEALENKKKIQKAQLAIDTAIQAGNLFTAISEIWAWAQAAGPFGTPIAIGTIAAMIGSFAAQKILALKTINEQAPGFAEGVIDLNGPGTGKSDSIPAWLSKGESVTPAEQTKNSKEVLRLIHAGKLTDYNLHEYAGKDTTQSPTFNDVALLLELKTQTEVLKRFKFWNGKGVEDVYGNQKI